MEEKHKLRLVLNKIECIRGSAESGNDDVFVKVYTDGKHYGTFFEDNTIKMNTGDSRYVDIEVDVTYVDKVEVNLVDKDPHGDRDDLVHVYLDRDDPLEGSRSAKQTSGKKKAEYRVFWRVLNKPVPTLRILGVRCEKSSAGCNEDLVDVCVEVASEITARCGKAIGRSPRPRAKLISQGFKVASDIIGECADLIKWIANALEGADDVYLQHVHSSNPNLSGGGFFPEEGRNYKMNDKEEVCFEEEYFRFVLDRGEVTIQLRERDPIKKDISMGAITIKPSEYDRLKDQGAQVILADEYFRFSGSSQGAVYYICYSVGLEDWAKDANATAQGDPGE